ncbi:TKL/TKL-ccin protein kinase [Mycena amicta]|nr:TKL/TKL-ccin protein kinase [Mycena amicta]
MSVLQAPKAPSDNLQRLAANLHSRLALVVELNPFFDYIRRSKRPSSIFSLLWETLALGAPLCTLCTLLGSPPPRDLHFDPEKDVDLGLPHRERFFTAFIQRVQLLELQAKIPFGEVFRVQDLFGGTASGFAKVLKTVERVLVALQYSYPGIFHLPHNASSLRLGYVRDLIDSERVHLATLRMTGDSLELLAEGQDQPDPSLECLIVTREVLQQYHKRVLRLLEEAMHAPLDEPWVEIFALEDATRKHVVGAYRSICANFLGLEDVLQGYLDMSEPLLASHAQILLTNVSVLLTRASTYRSLTEKILSVTSPADCRTYDSLCSTVFSLTETAQNLDEMGRLLRTIHASRIFKARAFKWRADIDPAELGSLLIDDFLSIDGAGLMRYAVFLFETMLLCCLEVPAQDGKLADDDEHQPFEYPIRSWELGPALARKTPLNLVHAVPTTRLKLVRLSDSDSFELVWNDDKNGQHVLEFFASCPEQHDQWRDTLETFVPSEFKASTGEEAPFSEDEDVGGRRRSHARSWSLIARKGPRSESSSLLHQDGCISDQESLLSPQLLPRFFGPGSQPGSQEVSPLAINTTFPRHTLDALGEGGSYSGEVDGFEAPLTPPPDLTPHVEADQSVLLNLTGQIRKEGHYPQAHGGFADVWKGVWNQQPDRWVAIKVLRSRLDDVHMEVKMKKRLLRELSVWKRLSHQHVLKLLGTVSDFGPYDSMVCPWLEQGSVSKYMERRGDILSMTDRLQLLCEVAAGLQYLHKNSIVHGDLTGSNILIDDEGHVKLCDFGLSTIVAEICGSHSLTTSIGGAVRWADSALYTHLSIDDGNDEATQNNPIPVLTTHSDIYSFGSVMLEILSGRIPYHYVKTDAQVVIELHKGNKPRRPAASFVTDAQWALITCCWHADLAARPDCTEVVHTVMVLHRASLEFRRHTY